MSCCVGDTATGRAQRNRFTVGVVGGNLTGRSSKVLDTEGRNSISEASIGEVSVTVVRIL
jgi:hypothetical protein